MNVTCHADHTRPRLLITPACGNTVSNRILIWPVVPGHSVIHNDNWRSLRLVAWQKGAAREQRNSKHAEVVRTGKFKVDLRHRFIGVQRLSFNDDSRAHWTYGAVQRNGHTQCGALNSRCRLYAVKSLMEEVPGSLALLVFCPVQTYLHGEHIRALKSRIDRQQVIQTAHHQTRTDEKHERDRNLRRHQQVAHTRPTSAACCAFPCVTQTGQTNPARNITREHSKQQACKQRHSKAKQQYASIQTNSGGQRGHLRGIVNQQLRTDCCNAYADAAACQGNHHTFREQLKEYVPSAGSFRYANRHLARPLQLP